MAPFFVRLIRVYVHHTVLYIGEFALNGIVDCLGGVMGFYEGVGGGDGYLDLDIYF